MAFHFFAKKKNSPETETTAEIYPGSAPEPDLAPAEDAGEYTVSSPVTGNVVARETIPDPALASGVLGDGVGIEPEDGVVTAPFDGEISSVIGTGHAVGLTGPGRMEILIHVGVDTVKMKGDGFELFVREGDRVAKGQKLLTFDMEKIRAAGCSTTVAVLVINSDDFSSCETKLGRAEAGDQIILIRK